MTLLPGMYREVCPSRNSLRSEGNSLVVLNDPKPLLLLLLQWRIRVCLWQVSVGMIEDLGE